jgi:cytochrome c553
MKNNTPNLFKGFSAFNKSFIIFVCLFVTISVFIACGEAPDAEQPLDETKATEGKAVASKDLSDPELIKKGGYLVTAMGCDDCHSPKKMGAQGPEIIADLRFSGFQSGNKTPKIDTTQVRNGWVLFTPDLTSAVGPWGQSFAANISSDSTGIGSWKEEQFFKAIREGKQKGLDGTRPLLPPMPWPNYAKLSDEDLRAIFAYLRSTTPVKNVVPAPRPPHMLN